jgi:WD40 repeat protein
MNSPFKFLDSYTREDRAIFFGRDREIEELYHRVFESRILLVYGISGTGKSSLINCGLANKFSETDWLPLNIRRGTGIIQSMGSAVSHAAITPVEETISTPAGFIKAVRSLYLDHYKPLFFIFDQFEELFIFGTREERREFISIVKALTGSDLQCRFIFVMREEYMAGVTEFEKVIPTFFSNRLRIEKMSHLNALEAIEGPCNAFNISVEEGFAEALLEKLSPGEADVELTWLQVFLDKIFHMAAENPPPAGEREAATHYFTLSLLEKTGNVSDILGSFLDEQIALMPDPGSALSVLKSFVFVKGTKQPMNLEEAREYALTLGKDLSDAEMNDLILAFVNLRILCDKDQDGRYELRHDALAAKIYEKFTVAEKELLEVRKYIENAYYAYENRGLWLSKDDLDYLADYENRLFLPRQLTDFITLSKEKLNARSKALKRITTTSILVFLLILAVALRFYISTMEEGNINNIFRSTLMLSVTDPLEGLIAELDLWRLDSTSSQLHSLILNDFQRILSSDADSSEALFQISETFKPVNLKADIVKAGITSDGKYITGWLEDQSVFIFTTGSREIKYFRPDDRISSIEVAEECLCLAVICENNRASVYDFDGNRLYDFTVSLNDVTNKNLVRFFPRGCAHTAAAKDNIAQIYDSTGNIIDELRAHSGRVNSADISPDGKFMVTASDDRLVYIWRYNDNTGKFLVYDTLRGHTDRIWSCRFNKTGKYIFTASADSTIRIWDLKGIHINPQLNFMLHNTRWRFNTGEYDEDAFNPRYADYYGKFCDASFSRLELEIIATGYHTSIDSAGNTSVDYHKVLFYDGTGGFPYGYRRSFFVGPENDKMILPMKFSELVISAPSKLAAATETTGTQSYLITGTNYIIMTVTGKNPMFATDGKDFCWTSGEKIFSLPVHPEKIRKIIEPLRKLSATDKPVLVEI